MGAFDIPKVSNTVSVMPQDDVAAKKKKKKKAQASDLKPAIIDAKIPADPMVNMRVKYSYLKAGNPLNSSYKSVFSSSSDSSENSDGVSSGGSSSAEIIANEMDNMAQDDINAKIIAFEAEKGIHGQAMSDNRFECVGGNVSTSGFATSNEVDMTYGKGDTNTQISVCSDLEYLHQKSYSSEMPYEDTTNSARTRSSEPEPEPEPPTPPPHSMTITDTKSYDVFVGHNRPFDIKGIKGTLGLGGDFHYHDSGDNIYGTVRAVVQPKNGIIRCSFDSTRRSILNSAGGHDTTIDNRFRVKFLNNKDSVVMENDSENSGDDSGSGTDRTEVRVKNKGEFEFILDDSEMGLKYSYILRDYGGIDPSGNYKRFRIYGGVGATDDTSEDRDKGKFMANALCKYENTKTNGNYTNAELDLGYSRTVQKGTHPQDIAFGKALFSAKRGKHTLTSSANYLWTNDTKLGFFNASYGFDINKNVNLGATASYVSGKQSGMDVNYQKVGAKVTYSF
ncbi:hypothetical protein IKQ21_04550 [bacterium]|nr:hypothetical protein [bacterium]